MLRGVSVFVCLLACSASEPSAATKSGDAAPTDCTAKIATMRALFAHGAGDPIAMRPPDGDRLPESTRGVAVDDGLPVFVRADGSYRFDNQPRATSAELLASLREESDKASTFARNTGQPFTIHYLLAADARAPVASVRAIVEAGLPGAVFVMIVHVTGDAIPTPPPMPPSVRAVLEETAADERATRLAGLLEPIAAACPPVRDVFGGVASAAPDERSKVVFDGLPAALEKCGCAGDFDVLLSAVWTMGGKTSREVRQISLPVAAGPGVDAIEVPADATVEDLVRLLETRGDRPIRFAGER